jgi:hypothetical protein
MIVDRMIVVQKGMEAIRLDPVLFVSAIPLANTAETNDAHAKAAADAASRTPDLICGAKSSIVIVVRSFRNSDEAQHPARGLELRTLDGTSLVSLKHKIRVAESLDPVATLHVAVNPGAYLLALKDARNRCVEQIVVACEEWETQVFLLATQARGGRADLINGAITIRRPSAGFDPNDPDVRLEEMARAALRDDHDILSNDVRKRITSPDAPPILAILGALLLIREAKDSKLRKEALGDAPPHIDNTAAVRTIVNNLRSALGARSHPDVEAIAIGAGVADAGYVFDAPPMFRGSWRLLLKAGADRPGLVPADSLCARVATRLWGDGPSLLFLDPNVTDGIDRAAILQSALRQALTTIEKEVRQPAAASKTTFATPVVNALRWVKSIFTRRVRHDFPQLVSAPATPDAEPVSSPDLVSLAKRLDAEGRRKLVKHLGVPMSSIDAWIEKLGE